MIATARAEALEPMLSRLTITVPAASEVSGLHLERDGVAIERASWGMAIPVDPGAHVLVASATGRRPWTHTVQVAPGGASTTVAVPLLELQPEAATARAPATVAPGAPAVAARPDASSGGDPGAGQRLAGLVVGGLGLAGIGVGLVFGVRSRSKQDESRAYCDPANPSACDRHGVELNDEAKSAATIATVGYAAGGALVIGGVVLYLTAPRASAPGTAGVRVVPVLGAGSAGLGATGAW